MVFRRALVVAAVTGAAALPARAAITGLTVAPAQTTPGHAITITVGGSGPCTFDLDFGENGAKTTLSGPLPKSTQWVYLSTGTKTVSAVAKAPCTGSAQNQVHVSSPLAALCQKVDCAAVFAVPACKPEIAHVYSAATPGAEILVTGSCLAGAGTLGLLGQFPLGEVKVTVLEWRSTYVRGLIPDSITGVPDQKVRVRIVKKNQDFVESYPFDFAARRELRILPGKDVTMTLDYGNGSNGSCEQSDWNSPTFTVDCGWFNPTVDYDNDTGTDKLDLHLKSGWKTHHRAFDWSATKSEGSVSGNDGFKANVADLTLSYKWVADNDPNPFWGDSSVTTYTVTVFIEGPAGTSWK